MKKIFTKAQSAVKKVEGAVLGAYTAAQVGLTRLYCVNVLNGGSSNQEVTVNSNITGAQILNRIVTIMAGVFVIVGLFGVVSGVFKYLEAKQDENSAGENKATRQIGLSIVMIAAPAVLIYIFK
jgi:heme/copper-type cytochrome/quinol oxidase subunit 2